jgi:hypothetical protein
LVNASALARFLRLLRGTQMIQHHPAGTGELHRIAHRDLQFPFRPVVAQRDRGVDLTRDA